MHSRSVAACVIQYKARFVTSESGKQTTTRLLHSHVAGVSLHCLNHGWQQVQALRQAHPQWICNYESVHDTAKPHSEEAVQWLLFIEVFCGTNSVMPAQRSQRCTGQQWSQTQHACQRPRSASRRHRQQQSRWRWHLPGEQCDSREQLCCGGGGGGGGDFCCESLSPSTAKLRSVPAQAKAKSALAGWAFIAMTTAATALDCRIAVWVEAWTMLHSAEQAEVSSFGPYLCACSA